MFNQQFFPRPITPSRAELEILLQVETPAGIVDLNSTPYQLAANTLSEISTQFRKTEVSSPYVEGSWVTNAVRDNVTMTIEMYVRSNGYAELMDDLTRLQDAFSQQQFTMYFSLPGMDVIQVWACQTSDQAIQIQREFLHAQMALFHAEVPRLPGYDLLERT